MREQIMNGELNKRLNPYFNALPNILKLANILAIEGEVLIKEYSSIIRDENS